MGGSVAECELKSNKSKNKKQVIHGIRQTEID